MIVLYPCDQKVRTSYAVNAVARISSITGVAERLRRTAVAADGISATRRRFSACFETAID